VFNLYVDDVRECPWPDWKVARTIEDAKLFLKTGEVCQLSLDHDMGACAACIARGLHVGDMKTPATTFSNWCPHYEDGTKLVHWMIETGHWSKMCPIVHSANPVGRTRMCGMIVRYFFDPDRPKARPNAA